MRDFVKSYVYIVFLFCEVDLMTDISHCKVNKKILKFELMSMYIYAQSPTMTYALHTKIQYTHECWANRGSLTVKSYVYMVF
jgi:hypothetical protein